ncbi:MAG TPA: hypothetical protein VFL76_03495 [Edaphocola sp.]|nr:hypothetical protein [Edaphocola sp.]
MGKLLYLSATGEKYRNAGLGGNKLNSQNIKDQNLAILQMLFYRKSSHDFLFIKKFFFLKKTFSFVPCIRFNIANF